MKKIILSIFCTIFALSMQAQYNIDWTNAPINPLPAKYTLNHFNIKGNVINKSDETETYTFNNSGKLTTAKRDEIEQFTYNSKGHLQSKSSDNSSCTYKCDAKGRIIEVKNTVDGGTKNSYNAKGLWTACINSETGHFINKYTYDAKGRIMKNEYYYEGELHTITTYKYKQSGKDLLVDINEEIIGSSKSVDTYIYNNRGDCISNCGTAITYKYDKHNNIVSANFGSIPMKYSYIY